MSTLERFTTSATALVLAGKDGPVAIRPPVHVEASRHATLALVGGDHMRALSDPRFTAAIDDLA